MSTAISRRDFLKTTAAATAAGPILVQPARKRPNILFFFPDQHRHDWLGPLLPGAVRTPNLMKLSAHGVLFKNCWCPSPLCAPSRACLAAGREYPRAHVASNKFNYPLEQPTFYAKLREAGYTVLGCGKFDLNKGEHRWGLDGRYKVREWGFSDGVNNGGKWDVYNAAKEGPADPYSKYLGDHDLLRAHLEDFSKRRGEENRSYAATFPTPLPENAYCDNWIAAQGLRLIDEAPKGKPWFLQVNFAGPHPPVDITQKMDGGCRDLTPPPPNRNTQFDQAQHRAIRQNYSAMIENIDRWLGIYLDHLKERGELEDTLVVYSSDHGEMLGDHDLWGKTKPHQPSVGVPLMMAGPGIQQGVRSPALVSLIDLPATFTELAGVAPFGEGKSLMPLLSNSGALEREHLFSALGDWQAIRDQRWKLIKGYPEKESLWLFDLDADPLENENVADRNPEMVSRLTGAMKSFA